MVGGAGSIRCCWLAVRLAGAVCSACGSTAGAATCGTGHAAPPVCSAWAQLCSCPKPPTGTQSAAGAASSVTGVKAVLAAQGVMVSTQEIADGAWRQLLPSCCPWLLCLAWLPPACIGPASPLPSTPANATLRLLPAPLLACLAVLKGLDESGVLMLDGEEFYLTH